MPNIMANLPAEFKPVATSAKNIERSLTLRVPGSTANLGPAFDTMGLALNVHTWLQFVLLRQEDLSVPLIAGHGEICEKLPMDSSNFIFQILTKLWQQQPMLLRRIRISSYTNIPTERGLGSSGTVIAATCYAARVLRELDVRTDALLLDCALFENHIDNMSASLLGGLVISHHDKSRSRVFTSSLQWPTKWKTIVVVPPYATATAHARALLPSSWPQADVISNLQRIALLTTAISRGDERLLKEALHDSLHEPYRLALVPALHEVRAVLMGSPALGCVLSGAGSAVLVVVPEKDLEAVLKLLRNDSITSKNQILSLAVDEDGLTEVQMR
ncbi:MAG: homoserine kinase [Candidatus Obscuribacterales bacterium]|nr:homoserine kinase [Candidatus Obscuribacterales bacterium]